MHGLAVVAATVALAAVPAYADPAKPACSRAAQSLAKLIGASDKAQTVIGRRCDRDRWSRDAQTCFGAAATTSDSCRCVDKLSKDQRTQLEGDADRLNEPKLTMWLARRVLLARPLPPPTITLAVFDATPDVFAHNLETVRRLHGRIRPAFGYDRTLEVLRTAQSLREGQVTKSNLILGMGERADEIPQALRDLADAGARIVTIGQYLRPTEHHLPVDRWVHPDEFARWKELGESFGIAHVEAGPLVRSSYHAGKQFRRATAGV